MWDYTMRMIVSIFLLLIFTSVSFSSIIQVPADYRSIQEAIEKSQDGDTILVSPGTYYENINILNKIIMVKSTKGAESTVIDGGHASYVVRFENQETPGSILEGFTITNGLGGIICHSSSPSLLKNIVERNQLLGGVAIGGSHSSPLVYGNIIRNNYSEQVGGGILCGMSTSGIIENNVIMQNASNSGGGGIFCDLYDSYEYNK